MNIITQVCYSNDNLGAGCEAEIIAVISICSMHDIGQEIEA